MIYASWGIDSDITLLRSILANNTRIIECVGCSLVYEYQANVLTGVGTRGAWVRVNDEPYQFQYLDDVIEHLSKHRDHGDTIPEYADTALAEEINQPTEAWLPQARKAPTPYVGTRDHRPERQAAHQDAGEPGSASRQVQGGDGELPASRDRRVDGAA